MSQYYTVQHASPKHLHRFYSDASTLTYGDVRPEGCVTRNATGQKVRGGRVLPGSDCRPGCAAGRGKRPTSAGACMAASVAGACTA